MPTYLDRILAAHRRAAGEDRREVARLRAEAAAAPPARPFRAALAARPGISVIAEVKRRSPSKGALAPGLDPAQLARDYARGGAACLSVLTDVEFFGGSPADLASARSAVALPALRKDFTVCEADVYDARIMGADAVLLIVSALSPAELGGLLSLARHLGLDALVEVHDEAEAALAVDSGADLIGVNQRDLVTFEVDTDRAVRVVGSLPGDVVKVAESGIRDSADVERLAGAGFDAVLVGEALVTAEDPGHALAGLLAGARAGAV
jgi:indole-3-glycerol phosphate synthase